MEGGTAQGTAQHRLGGARLAVGQVRSGDIIQGGSELGRRANTCTLNRHKADSHSAAKTTIIRNSEEPNMPYEEGVIAQGLPDTGA